MHEVNALLFDVFGTLVDWRGSVAREARAILSPLGIAIDGEAFADAWRATTSRCRACISLPQRLLTARLRRR